MGPPSADPPARPLGLSPGADRPTAAGLGVKWSGLEVGPVALKPETGAEADFVVRDGRRWLSARVPGGPPTAVDLEALLAAVTEAPGSGDGSGPLGPPLAETAVVAPVWSWAIRLWPWEGRDLLHGLVRIEAAPRAETLAQVDQLSRWLIAERSPVSTPDPRRDRLLYGIRAVEQYLRASGER